MSLLAVDGLQAWYGDSHVLQGITFELAAGRATALLGRNGAGKTTLLKTIMGLVPRSAGTVRLAGGVLTGLAPHRVARAGLAYVPETRGIFPSLSVAENLDLVARSPDHDDAWTVDRIYDRFPRLYERRANRGGHLSGGEQQMLAIARALVTNGRVLLLDEPTEGLAPTIVDEVISLLSELKTGGQTIFLVEQNYAAAKAIADDVLVLGKGQLRWRGTPATLNDAGDITETWLGV